MRGSTGEVGAKSSTRDGRLLSSIASCRRFEASTSISLAAKVARCPRREQ